MKNERIARQTEILLGHSVIPGKHNRAVISALKRDGLTEIADKLLHLNEIQSPIPAMIHSEWQIAKHGVRVHEHRLNISESWLTSDTTECFIAELAKRGYLLSKGTKAPIAVSYDGQEIPLLRAINVGLKAKGISRIKRSELCGKLPKNLAPTHDISSNFETYIRRELSKATPRSNTMFPSTNRDREKWNKYRHKLLSNLYNTNFAHDFSRYWCVYQLKDGSLMLQNSAGRIIDRGNLIQSIMDNDELAAKTMAEMALARNWKTVIVEGSDSFKRAQYIHARNRGLKVLIENEHDQKIWDSIPHHKSHEQAQKYNHRTHHSRGLSLG